MKPRRFHGLKRPKLRQSWNKYNLFNIARTKDPRLDKENTTFFQQKWRAKGLLRTYHGEHIVERKWERMFSRRLLSVIDMDPKYMAKHDGSELASGRGSGKEKRPTWAGRLEFPITTPYMHMTFAPMERRLDIAVFRALFASSARQARQFCVHGAVKVNGKVVPYPAYRLNPGDMFQVDPERVLYATGMAKDPRKFPTRRALPGGRAAATEVVEEGAESEGGEATAEGEPKDQAIEAKPDSDTADGLEPAPVDMKPTRKQIQDLTAQAKAILKEEGLSVARKQNLRSFLKSAKSLLSRAGRASATPAAIANELSTLIVELDVGAIGTPAPTEEAPTDPIDSLSKRELDTLVQRMDEHMREEAENPFDPSKPYMTPWRPRDYMSAFAFIPQYLEVNQNICSAVYLRHPVARAGNAEVPTPYPISVSQLAFNWYLRRR